MSNYPISEAQLLKDDIGWHDNMDAAWLASRVMKLCDHAIGLEWRIRELEEYIAVLNEDKDIMHSVELYKDSGR